MTLGRKVVFENGVEGVIYFEQMSEGGSFDVDMKRMFIDIGAATRAEALSKVQIGDAATYAPGVIDMGTRMSSPAMDNRAGCAVLVELLRDMQTDNEVACVFSTQEEVGLRGAKAAAFALDPDMGIALDVTPTRDTPKGFPHSVVLGKGPTIKIMDASLSCNPQVVADMRAAADRGRRPLPSRGRPAAGRSRGLRAPHRPGRHQRLGPLPRRCSWAVLYRNQRIW